MIKLGILFQEEETTDMDLSHPELGNPGVGGTAFCFLLLCKYLEPCSELSMTVYQFQNNILPCAGVKRVSSIDEALQDAKKEKIEILLLRNHQEETIYHQLKNYDFKYIFWMHNKLTYEEIKLFSKWPAVKRVISVGREMYDYYVDDLIINKMDYILNPFVPPAEDKIRDEKCPLNVTYVGSLTYDKNFHLLAEAWKTILKAVPDANLHVIGSGKLYDKNSVMGEWGYAEKSYEDLFVPHLSDENGNCLKSVHFHGILGEEKYDVFCKTAVGVVNPMATETFCLCAIEMEACGVPVVTRRKNGLLDTVLDGETGILYNDVGQLAPSVIRLLQDWELNDRYGRNAILFARTTFLPERLVPEWIRVIQEVDRDKRAVYRKPNKNMDNNGKWIRQFLHGIHSCPLFRWVPSVHDIQKK